jgi:glutaconate CoA-transferase subunit B
MREMTLVELAPGESVEAIREEVGWELNIATDLKEISPPEPEELTIIREQLDPEGLYR